MLFYWPRSQIPVQHGAWVTMCVVGVQTLICSLTPLQRWGSPEMFHRPCWWLLPMFLTLLDLLSPWQESDGQEKGRSNVWSMEVFSYLPLFRWCFGKQDGLGQANLDWIMISVFLIFLSCLPSQSDMNFYWHNLLWQIPPEWHTTSELLCTQCAYCCTFLTAECQMVKNGLGFCVKPLPVCLHHSKRYELFLTNVVEKERKTIQKFTCKWLNKACNRRTVPCSFSSKIRLGMLLAWELFRYLDGFWKGNSQRKLADKSGP